MNINDGLLEIDLNFQQKIIFSAEAYFSMNGYVNNQNCRIWNDMNPDEILDWRRHHPYFFLNTSPSTASVIKRWLPLLLLAWIGWYAHQWHMVWTEVGRYVSHSSFHICHSAWAIEGRIISRGVMWIGHRDRAIWPH